MAVVPDWPHRHLDDPSYWGLLAYLVVFVLVLALTSGGVGRTGRALLRVFLFGLPLIYVANWVRFGGSTAVSQERHGCRTQTTNQDAGSDEAYPGRKSF